MGLQLVYVEELTPIVDSSFLINILWLKAEDKGTMMKGPQWCSFEGTFLLKKEKKN